VKIHELLDAVDVMFAPPGGLWRVGRAPEPLRPSRIDPANVPGSSAAAGNRWDSPQFGVRYFASDLEGCFGEVLARYRPSLALADLVREEWTGERMAPGQLPRDWRDRRAAVHGVVDPGWIFLNVETLKTRMFLQQELALGLSALGVRELDVPEVRGRDRRVTQLISEWAYQCTVEIDAETSGTPFAGIRYTSRVSSDWECWAIYENTPIEVTKAQPIPATMPALRNVCDLFKINVH
jgi:hypothetical protein